MKRKLLFCTAVLIMIITACNNPFFPAKRENRLISEETTPVNTQTPVIVPNLPDAEDTGVNTETPVIASNLPNAECTEGEEILLTVNVEGDEDDYEFQWYSNTENSNEGGTPIPGATDSSYKPPTDEVGTTYYYVVITNKRNGKTTKSNPVKVTVYPEGTFIVTFDSNGGSNVPGIQLTPNTTVSRPENPTLSGYVFDYWYQNAELTMSYNFDTLVTADITLYARWVSVSVIHEIANNMLQITGGTFMMGSPAGESGRISDETQHSVTLTKNFKMSKYQVTQEQYQAVMGSNPSNFTAAVAGESGTPGKLPVEMVRWYDAIVFCNKLSLMEGLNPVYSINGSIDPANWGTVPTSSNAAWNAVIMVSGANGYRLPTEAEWEYACRAGTTTAFNNGNNDYTNTTSVGAVGWFNFVGGSTHKVGLKAANAWGLYDMHGNVWEWCWDWFGTYASGAQTDPEGAVTGTIRVTRGGGWVDGGRALRSALRHGDNPAVGGVGYPSRRYYDLGFRLVRG